MRIPFVAALVLWCASAGAASAVESETTGLVTKRCKVTAIETHDEAGEPLARTERYPTAWRCNGSAGRFVYVRYDHLREEIAFGSSKAAATAYLRHGHFGGWGPTVEWRGARDATGKLVATAAIVPYRWSIREGDGAGKPDIGNELGVIRLGKGRNDTCIVAWVDAIANPDALEIARKIADDQASAFTCGKQDGERRYVGKRSRQD